MSQETMIIKIKNVALTGLMISIIILKDWIILKWVILKD